MFAAGVSIARRCRRLPWGTRTISTVPPQTSGFYHGQQDAALRASNVEGATGGLDAKSSIIFAVRDGPGALQSVLALFSTHGVNMTRIESRPSKGP